MVSFSVVVKLHRFHFWWVRHCYPSTSPYWYTLINVWQQTFANINDGFTFHQNNACTQYLCSVACGVNFDACSTQKISFCMSRPVLFIAQLVRKTFTFHQKNACTTRLYDIHHPPPKMQRSQPPQFTTPFVKCDVPHPWHSPTPDVNHHRRSSHPWRSPPNS